MFDRDKLMPVVEYSSRDHLPRSSQKGRALTRKHLIGWDLIDGLKAARS